MMHTVAYALSATQGDMMPAPSKTTRSDWIEAALRALAHGGPDAIRVETIAASMDVTKGGFYGHFDGRPALLEAVLQEWEARCTREIVARVELEDDDPRQRIRRVGQLSYSDELHRIDLAVRAWARNDTAVTARLRTIDNERMNFLRANFRAFVSDPAEVEARSTLAFSLAIGRHFLVADHPGYSTQDVLVLASDYLLRPEA